MHFLFGNILEEICLAKTQLKYAGTEFSIASCVVIPVSLVDKKTLNSSNNLRNKIIWREAFEATTSIRKSRAIFQLSAIKHLKKYTGKFWFQYSSGISNTEFQVCFQACVLLLHCWSFLLHRMFGRPAIKLDAVSPTARTRICTTLSAIIVQRKGMKRNVTFTVNNI